MATLNFGAVETDGIDSMRIGQELAVHVSENTTCGQFQDEAESCAEFDRIMRHTDLFVTHREVWGYLLQPRLGQETNKNRMRIDRVLWPTPKMRDLGWLEGPIGVECKRSGTKIGPVLLQCEDYRRCAFDVKGFHVMLQWVFVWPLEKQRNAVASVMSQNRIGSAVPCRNGDIQFVTSSGELLRIGPGGREAFKKLTMGNKAGSR